MNLLLRRLAVLPFLAAPLLCTYMAGAADPKLVEAARKEGKLVAYVSMLTENATALLAEFKKEISVHRHFALPRQHAETSPQDSIRGAHATA